MNWRQQVPHWTTDGPVDFELEVNFTSYSVIHWTNYSGENEYVAGISSSHDGYTVTIMKIGVCDNPVITTIPVKNRKKAIKTILREIMRSTGGAWWDRWDNTFLKESLKNYLW